MSFHPNQDSKTHQGSKGSLLQIKKPDSFNITKTDEPLYYTPFWRDGNIFLISFFSSSFHWFYRYQWPKIFALEKISHHLTHYGSISLILTAELFYHQVQWHFLNFSIVVVLQLQWYKKNWSKHTPRETQSCRDL